MNHDMRRHRVLNFFVAVFGMIGVFGIYIYTASRAPMSDNIGVLIVPFSVLLIYGPLISIVCAFIQTVLFSRTHDDYRVSFSNVFQRVSKLFKALGVLGLLAILGLSVTIGLNAAGALILFPFWAVKYLF